MFEAAIRTPALQREDVIFQSGGDTLAAWLFAPAGDGPRPAVVMANGWGAVRTLLLDVYAETIALAGLVVLAFDHPGFGDSGGEPRQEIDPGRQQQAYRDAIGFLADDPRVDPARIGVWGTSYSGGHVLALGASDERVACVVAQCPTISGAANTRRRFPAEVWGQMQARFAADRKARERGEPAAVIPAIPNADPADFERIVPLKDDIAGNDPASLLSLPLERRASWRPAITLRSVELYAGYEPGADIDRIAPTPLLMIVADDDTITPTRDGLEAFERAGEPKRLLRLPGGHYDLYAAQLQPAAEAARDWFAHHLGAVA